MEHDLYESQRKVWKIIKSQRKDLYEFIQINDITEEQRIEHFLKLYGKGEEQRIGEETNGQNYVTNNKDLGNIAAQQTRHLWSGEVSQDDSLSTLLFNLIMNEIICETKKQQGYGIGNHKITIICYVDDAILIAENEDNLQRQLYTFHLTTTKFNLKISVEKTKSMVISKYPRQCKLEIEDKCREQI
ncbi:hypothetical protein M0802_014054 [Mischocyttarus mexicanus]|nr:hypothetical protein M0802_014054 [Mischocyttarus mexicanus]